METWIAPRCPASGPTSIPARFSGLALTLALALVLALALLAAPAAASPSWGSGEWSVEARDLLIETVTVEGVNRVSPELIVGESLLEEGRSYSERELDAAVRRVRHLPFILDAGLTLRKGSHRGAYELVIAVVESRRFFFGANLELVALGTPLALEDEIRPDSLGLTDELSQLRLAAGVRWFTGAHGVVFAGFGEGGLRAGVLQYDLLDRHIFASFQVSVGPACCVQRVFPLGLDPGLGRWNLEDTRQVGIEVGVPLSAVDSVRVSLNGLDGDGSSRTEILGRASENGLRIFFGDSFEHWRLRAGWVHDSTDDPVLPTRGTMISAGLDAETLDSRQTVTTFTSTQSVAEALPPLDARYVALEALAVRHLELTRRQTVSLSGSASVGRSTVENLLAGRELLPEEDFTSYSASASVRWSIDLRSPRGLRSNARDLRLEVGGGYGWESTSPNLQLAGNPLEKVDFQVALVLRNEWGLFRFGLAYLDVGEVLR